MSIAQLGVQNICNPTFFSYFLAVRRIQKDHHHQICRHPKYHDALVQAAAKTTMISTGENILFSPLLLFNCLSKLGKKKKTRTWK
jgi:hypothetical protein